MRVLLVTPRFAPDVGGIETVVAQLAAALTQAGHSVAVATQSSRGLPRHEVVDIDGTPVPVFRAHRFAGTPQDVPAPGLYRLIRRLSRTADVVHAHSYHTLAAPIAAVAGRDRPLVLSLHYHGDGHSGSRRVLHRLYRPIGRRLVAAADVVQANSQAEAAFVVRDFAAELAAPPVVVTHGVAAPAPAVPFPTARQVVLSVCRLEPYKRVATLIEASALWTYPAELVVVGDGPDRARLEALATRLEAPVRFAGRVSDDELARWWATATVFASASADESFALTVAQARAVGVPAVVSAIDAHRELLGPTAPCAGTLTPDPALVHGVLVDGTDPHRWADAVDATLATLPVAGRPAPVAARSWGQVAAEYVDLYTAAAR